MRSILTTLFVGLSMVLLFTACQNESSSKSNQDDVNNNTENSISQKLNASVIAPPFENVNVPFNKMTVVAEKGGTLSLDNGTQIIIPKSAFTDANGQPITGEVAINYREFHDAADIIASGIPMTDKDGNYMQTAGMFEIKGEQNQQPIQIAADKSVEIKMASFVEDGQNYDFFRLDENSGEWDNKTNLNAKTDSKNKNDDVLASDLVEKNIVKLRKVKALPKVPETPVKPKSSTADAFKFDFNVNYKKFPELRAYEGVVWEYSGTDPKTNPENNEWIFGVEWADIDLKKTKSGKYKIVLDYNDKHFETDVQPVMEGKNLQEAMYEFEQRQEKYTKIKAEVEAEKERLVEQADMLRTFKVQGFGVYNWDVWKQEGRQMLSAKFDFGKSVNKDVSDIMVFLVTANRRSVIKFTEKTANRFSFDPTDENELIAVLSGNRVGVFTKNDFGKMDIDALKRAGKAASYTFKMTIKDKTIKSPNDLKGMFASL